MKSSPNENSEGGFQPWVPPAEAEGAPPPPEAPLLDVSNHDFQFSETLWEVLKSDKQFQAELEKVLGDRVREVVEKRVEEAVEVATKKAQEEGFAAGVAEGKAKLDLALSQVEKVSSDLVNEKSRLLEEHAQAWSAALKYLLTRFLAKPRDNALDLLEAWMAEGLQAFQQSGKVRVKISPALNLDPEILKSKSDGRIEWVIDATLASGAIECDCESGGFFFSPGVQLEKLEKILEQSK